MILQKMVDLGVKAYRKATPQDIHQYGLFPLQFLISFQNTIVIIIDMSHRLSNF